MTRNGAAITAIGAYVPERILTNADLEKLVETSDEWIVRRTGIRERRLAATDEYTSHLCEHAIRDMQRRYACRLDDVDLILVSTHTPDMPFPSTACLLQARLSIPQAGALDLNATCAGFVYGLHVAAGLVTAGLHRKVLVVAGDTMSKITDYTDRTTCVLFGDGAGAALVERSDETSFLAHALASDGGGARHAYRTGLAATLNELALVDTGKFVQNGQEVFRHTVTMVAGSMSDVAAAAGYTLTDVDWFVPHSANMRMVEAICERSGYPVERALTSMAEFGNTSAASIPLAIVRGLDAGRIKTGDRVLLYGFGAGLVYGAVLLRWTL